MQKIYYVEVWITYENHIRDAKRQLHPDDRGSVVPGRYLYELRAKDADAALEAALDIFHLNVPIKELEDFHIWAELAKDS